MKKSMTKLLIATGNAHKLAEIKSLLAIPGLEICSMAAYTDAPDPIEDGESFEANALIKAHSLAQHTGEWALADDSGIEVDSLDKAPGIFSARYAGKHGDDAANNNKLMAEVAELEERTARFVAAIALVSPDGIERVCRATVEGDGDLRFAQRGFHRMDGRPDCGARHVHADVCHRP